jgi:hypothetical protein
MLLSGFERRRDAIAAAYRADGVSLTVPAAAVQTAQSRVASQGLARDLVADLRLYTKGSITAALKRQILGFAALKRQIARATPQGFDFVASLPNPRLALHEAKVAGALVGYANANVNANGT